MPSITSFTPSLIAPCASLSVMPNSSNMFCGFFFGSSTCRFAILAFMVAIVASIWAICSVLPASVSESRFCWNSSSLFSRAAWMNLSRFSFALLISSSFAPRPFNSSRNFSFCCSDRLICSSRSFFSASMDFIARSRSFSARAFLRSSCSLAMALSFSLNSVSTSSSAPNRCSSMVFSSSANSFCLASSSGVSPRLAAISLNFFIPDSASLASSSNFWLTLASSASKPSPNAAIRSFCSSLSNASNALRSSSNSFFRFSAALLFSSAACLRNSRAFCSLDNTTKSRSFLASVRAISVFANASLSAAVLVLNANLCCSICCCSKA